MQEPLSSNELKRLAKTPVRCRRLNTRIKNLSDFVATITIGSSLWYRGHGDSGWRLCPSALRYESSEKRQAALSLLSEFRRVAEMKLQRPPAFAETLRWVQLAQHFGVPTRLLDWTENPSVALYFACEQPNTDGVLYMMNPIDLNRASNRKLSRVLDGDEDRDAINPYFSLGESKGGRQRKTVAVKPTWNSDRIQLQKGSFTLHGTEFDLDDVQAPSLVGIPILREYKARLRDDLERMGVDEMTIFPELEHACRVLKRRSRL